MKKINKGVVLPFLLAFAATNVSAEVRVFRPDAEPTAVNSVREQGLFWGVKTFFSGGRFELDEVLDTLKAYPDVFRVSGLTSSSLTILGVQSDEFGRSLRLGQLHDGIPVEGAEAVALFDAEGALEVINSSLIEVKGEGSSRPELTAEQAMELAASELGLSHVEWSGIEQPHLRWWVKGASPQLVWRMDLRGASMDLPDTVISYRVWVAANGPRQGQLVRALDLTHQLASISIYDASVTVVLPNPLYKGVKVLENGRRTAAGRLVNTAEAEKANASFEKTLTFYERVFGRKSFDGMGAPIVASVNANRFLGPADVLGLAQNAAWMAPWKMFVFGSGGDLLGSFAESLDVVGHEFTHAVISSSSNLEYAGQSGGLNEHLADVFGAAVEYRFERPEHPFLIGDKCLKGELAKKAKALRDMLEPHRSLGGQPAHVREIPAELGPDCEPSRQNDNCGVHGISGVPNRAAALIIQALGWDRTLPLFYRVMTARLRSTSDFADYRNQMVDECRSRRLGSGCAVIVRAFEDVGL